MTPTEIADPRCECGEGPLWHTDRDELYWVDIPHGRLYRYVPASGEYEMVYEDVDRLGGATVQADGTLLLFGDSGAVKRWDEGSIETVIDRIPGAESTRFNDVIADPEGRVFAGMMGSGTRDGRLYRVGRDGSYTTVIDGLGTPNGLGFSPGNDYLYFTDSGANDIYRYEYERATGEISNGEVLISVPEEHGTPDGLTVDREGDIWSARWNGDCVARYDSNGQERERIELPAQRVTSVMFGGDTLDTLYATTAGGDNRSEEGWGAGAVFEIDVDATGVPEYRSRLST